jgi:transposase
MNRRQKVELFEQIRREYEFGIGAIAGVARQFGVHRRLVRQALQTAWPPERQRPVRSCPRLTPVRPFIEAMLEQDRQAPRKQRHTAHRIYRRLRAEYPQYPISERRVRQYVRARKLELGLLGHEVCIPQSYDWGSEGQVDWYEAVVELAGERQVAQVFVVRSMASGAAYHRAYPRATQQAFLDAHQYAFHYFGGVFRRLRYDNLTSAVKKILRGHQRQETTRFIAFRSHWQFEATFCTPAQGHEKGGVEGEVGYFRRNHLVPILQVANWSDLNERLRRACQDDEPWLIQERPLTVGQAMVMERPYLLPLQPEDLELTEEQYCRVDGKGRVQVRTNWYSTPLPPGTQVRVRVAPTTVAILHAGQPVACHERCYRRQQQVLNLEHYLEALARKPGALAGSTPLAQWRAAGQWTAAHDHLWALLQERQGSQEGTRQMIELLQLGRQHGYERLTRAIHQALTSGAYDAAAVRYFLTAPSLVSPPVLSLSPTEFAPSDYATRPLPSVAGYDQLLATPALAGPESVS